MSSCLAIYTGKILYMCADTAEVFRYKNDIYRINEDAHKIFNINGKIVFLTGLSSLTNLSRELFKKSDNSILSLRNSMILAYDMLKKQCENEQDYNLGAVVGCIENNKVVVYTIDSSNNFQIERNVEADDSLSIITLGFKTNEVAQTASYFFHKYKIGTKDYIGTILDVYKSTYNAVSCTEIGGNLEVWTIQHNNAIKCLNYPIADNGNIKKMTDIADYVNGKYILKNKHDIKDLNGRVKAKLGHYSPNTWGLQLFDDNGNTTLTGNEIDARYMKIDHISANSIDSGEIDANKVKIVNLDVSGNINTNDLHIKGENITDVINNASYNYGGTYINGSGGAGQVINGNSYNFKKMIKVGSGSISSGNLSATIDLGADFKGHYADVIVNLSGFNSFSSTLSGVNLTQANYNTSNGTFQIGCGIQNGDAGGQIYYSYIAIA